MKRRRRANAPSLWEQAQNLKPIYQTNAEAVVGLTEKLESIATKLGMSFEELFHETGHSCIFKDEYLESLVLFK